MAKQFEQQSSEILNKYIKPSNVDDTKETEEYKKAYDKLLLFYKANNDSDKLEEKIREKIWNKTNTLEKIKAFNEALLEAEKNQKPSKEEEKKAKKEAEEKWFSWEKITKIVKEKGGWFSLAWLGAWIGAIFSGLFSKFFGWIEDKIDSIVDYSEKKIESIFSKYNEESKWSFKNKEYISYEKKFDIKFNSSDNVEYIKINWEEYKIWDWYHLEVIDNKKCLVWWGNIKNNVFALDYLGYYFDNTEAKDIYNVAEKFDGKSKHVIPDLFKWEIEFKKETSLAEIEWNILKSWSWNTKIISENNIDKEKKVQDISIKEIEINWEKYKLSIWWKSKPLKFELIKKDNNYYIDYWVTTLNLKISEIENLVNKKLYKIDENNFSLYQLLDDDNKFFDTLKLVWTWWILNSKVWDTIILTKI